MKTISLVAIWCLLFGSALAGEAPPRDWRSLNPAQLREHVAKLNTLNDVVELLGKPPRPFHPGNVTGFQYKITDNLTLVIFCDNENFLGEKDQFRAVRSIYLFEKSAKEQRAIWKIFKGRSANDGMFRSDEIDIPAIKNTQAEQVAS